MLTLIAGKALAASRRSFLGLPVPDDRLFVVPDELSAIALTREIFGDVAAFSAETRVAAFDALVEKLTGQTVGSDQWVPHDIALAVVRMILEEDSASFDHLVGQHSAPRLSHGVLERIASAMQAFQKSQQSDDPPPVRTARGRQLVTLAGRFEERLSVAGYRLEKHAQLEALAALAKPAWKKLFPGINHVVFLDFLDHSDAEFMAVHAVARCVKQCDVLLDYDPEDDQHGHVAMETAYMRFHDMAEKVLLEPELGGGGQGDLFESVPGDGADVGALNQNRRPPVVVHVDAVSQEVGSVAAAVRKLLDTAEEGNTPSIVLALANWDAYAPLLERALEEQGIEADWQQSLSPLRCGQWLLLDRVRQCISHKVPGNAVSALLRAPGFPALLPGMLNPVEAWDLASRLDYVLTLTGKLEGWSSILKETGFMLGRLRKDRQRQKLWTEEEGQLDERLKEILSATRDLVNSFAGKATLGDWAQKVVAVLDSAPIAIADVPTASAVLQPRITSLMKQSAMRLAAFSPLFTENEVEFSRFLSLYRTLLYRETVDNSEELQSRHVTVCSPAIAARLRSDCCMVLGCNDGNLPRFARPEPAFIGDRSPANQAALLARQRATLHRIIRNHATSLLWMPKRVELEEALPSQFIEELLDNGEASAVQAEILLQSMEAPLEGHVGRAQKAFVENLRGLLLSEDELQSLRKKSLRAYQVAHSTSLLANRAQAHLGGYDGVISDPVLKPWLRQWADRHIYSVSQLDTVVGCSFRFFAERILNLEETEEADALLPAHAFGSFAHDVLAVFYRKWVAEGRDVPGPDDEMLARQELYKAYAAEFEDISDLSDFAIDLLNLKLFGDLGPEGFRDGHRELEEVRDAGVFGQFLLMEMRRGGNPVIDFLKPRNFEVGFGMTLQPDDDPLSIEDYLQLDLGDGEHIKVRGRIDRIDISESGVFAVTDYKTGKVPTQKSIVDSYRTQLPVYVMIARQLLEKRFPHAQAAGGLYYSLKKGENAKVSGAFLRSEFQHHAGVQGRCLKDEAFEETLEQVKAVIRRSVSSVRKGQLTTTWRDEEVVCGYCPFEGFCYRNVERTREFFKTLNTRDDSDEP